MDGMSVVQRVVGTAEGAVAGLADGPAVMAEGARVGTTEGAVHGVAGFLAKVAEGGSRAHSVAGFLAKIAEGGSRAHKKKAKEAVKYKAYTILGWQKTCLTRDAC